MRSVLFEKIWIGGRMDLLRSTPLVFKEVDIGDYRHFGIAFRRSNFEDGVCYGGFNACSNARDGAWYFRR